MARKTADTNEANGAENTAGYFRKIFEEKPRLLKERSNEELLTRWLADHPGHSTVPDTVKKSLGNIKSIMRSKKRKKVAKHAEEAAVLAGPTSLAVAHVARKPTGKGKLDELELQIDECMIFARQLDREGLQDVIDHLRRARNAVVWKLGQ